MNNSAAMITSTGGRKENQDFASYHELAGYGCYLVADGLGGHSGGALASRAAGEGVINAFKDSPGATLEHLKGYLEHARRKMQDLFSDKAEALKPLTTLVLLLTGNNEAVWAHMGDSRLYMFRGGAVLFQTADHSVPWQLASSGEIEYKEIRGHEDRNRLLRVFDGKDVSRVEYSAATAALQSGDLFLLCSDGFWEFVWEAEMESALSCAGRPEDYLSALQKLLLSRAPADTDNYTALAVSIA